LASKVLVSAERPSRRLGTPALVLMLLCAMYFLYFVNRVSISTLAPLIKTDLGITNTQLGLVFSAFAIPYAVFQLIGGWVGDRLGARITLAVCCTIVALSTILTSAASGMASLFAVRLALGFGEGAGFPTATRAMASWTSRGRWGFAQGIVHSFARIGNAVTPPLMAGLLLFSSWRGSLAILGLATLAWPIVWAWFFRNDPREHPAVTPAELAALPERRSRRPRSVPWARLAWHVLPVTLVDFCYGWTLWLFLSWLPAFFFENYHLNLQASAMFTAGVLLAGVIGDTAGGVVSDRILHRTGSLLSARRSVIVIGFLGAVIFLIPVVLIHDLTVAAISLSLAFFFARSCGDRERHDELRLRARRVRLAVQLRLSGRPDRQLGGPVHRVDRPPAHRRAAGVPPAAGPAVRDHTGHHDHTALPNGIDRHRTYGRRARPQRPNILTVELTSGGGQWR
jgi:sugar phosphate permease